MKDREILVGEGISMFAAGNSAGGELKRTPNCEKKLDRMNKTLRHEEADQIPVSDFFWGQFIERWKKDLNLTQDADIYKYYDLDWITTVPNMDPHIKNFEFIKNTPEEVIVRTGYEAEITKNMSITMPAFTKFHTDTIEKMEAFEFDDPWDKRRYFSAGDNQIAGVGDGFALNSPAWVDTVKSLYNDYPVYGSICEAHEQGWRIIGSENMMLWMGLYPEKLGKFIKRVGEYLIEMAKAQIAAADGLLSGMVIWGDVAYVNGMLFSPDYWREHFKPIVAEIINVCHKSNIPVIYHGCGDARAIYQDYIDIGLDSYNPLEAKAGLDVVDIRRDYGHKMGFCGNMDVMEWADLPMDELKAYVLRKLNVGKGGGFIFQSDHSVPHSVSGERYDYVVKLVREYGKYPLKLGEFDIPDLS
ncbi:MAG: uroporphyrinogen decarboxylase family protein [Spirochaetaceae bacterium]